MLKNITIGQYFPATPSPPPRPAHEAAVDRRPDRRGLSFAGFLGFAAVFGYVLLAARMSKIHLRFLVRGLKPVPISC